jgi:hypothetical protein
MQIDQILALLIAERNRLDAAIQALGSPAKRRGRPPAKKRPASTPEYHAPNAPAPETVPGRKRKISAAARKAMADAAKKRWAAIKAGTAANPFAKSKRKTAKRG